MDLNEIKIRQDLPYPEIEDAVECQRTVDVLKNLVSNKGGELNAVLQYVFQSTIADEADTDLGELFEEVGIVAMNHVGLLMHAITKFGGLPKYENSNGYPFSANCVNYSYRLKDILEENIQFTKHQIENYMQAINLVNNESLKNLLSRIAKDKELWLDGLKYLNENFKFLSK